MSRIPSLPERDVFVSAISLFVNTRRTAVALTRKQVGSLDRERRIDALRKALTLSSVQYCRENPLADATLAVLNIISLLQDNEAGACTMSQDSMARLLKRSRRTIITVIAKLREGGFIDTPADKSSGHKLGYAIVVSPDLVCKNHGVWLLEALEATCEASFTPVAIEQQPVKDPSHPTCEAAFTPQIQRVKDRAETCEGSFTLLQTTTSEVEEDKTITAREGCEVSKIQPESVDLKSWSKALADQQAARFANLASDWGLPVGHKGTFRWPTCEAYEFLWASIEFKTRQFDRDVVEEAAVITISEMPGVRFSEKTEKSRKGHVAAQRYFNTTFSGKLATLSEAALKHQVSGQVIIEEAKAKIEAERAINGHKVENFDKHAALGLDAASKRISSNGHAKASASPAPADRFDDSKWDVGSVHGFKITGEIANRILDGIPGATVKQIKDILFEANGAEERNFKESGREIGTAAKGQANPLKIVEWCSKTLGMRLAREKYGDPEKVAGGKPAMYTFKFDRWSSERTEPLKCDFAVVTEEFLDRMKVSYPKAFGGASMITSENIEAAMRKPFDYGRNFKVYGPEGQKLAEENVEKLFSNVHEENIRKEKAEAEWEAKHKAKQEAEKTSLAQKAANGLTKLFNPETDEIPFDTWSNAHA